MSPVEQPLPASTDTDRPYDDEPDWCIEEAAHSGAMAGAHYQALLKRDVPDKAAYRLTLAWMELRAGE